MAAWCHFWCKLNGWMDDAAQEASEGARLAQRAVELGKDDAVALTRGGHALAHLAGDLNGGIALIEQALMLNPNLAAAWYLAGFLQIGRGEHDSAIDRIARAMRLSPLDPEMPRMQAGTGMAHLLAGRFDAAASWAEMAIRGSPSLLYAVVALAASHALTGRMDQAQRAMRQMRQINPTLRISNLADWLPFYRTEDLATLAGGLRKAGLPE
jgi:tetratricopeptide (TPR) repeat protein